MLRILQIFEPSAPAPGVGAGADKSPGVKCASESLTNTIHILQIYFNIVNWEEKA